MGLSFKKLLKKAARGAVKIGGGLVKTAVSSTPIGQAAMKVNQALKSAGVSLKASRKIQPLSVRASIEKAAPRGPAKKLGGYTPGPRGKVKKTTRRKKRSSVFSIADFQPKAAKKAKAAKKPKATKKATSSKRKAPSGGLDLKAISALWKSQGKPGTWIGFIKANPLRKSA